MPNTSAFFGLPENVVFVSALRVFPRNADELWVPGNQVPQTATHVHPRRTRPSPSTHPAYGTPERTRTTAQSTATATTKITG